ncbi:MAG TPA: hypothetical protein PLE99_11265 [Candidatus Thiothrix moscowensis]|uniref:hypothetical protein n=1 Tax=unclassified Thiothrix TaxID=2636184 RepID=UPI0025F6A379|nr:MULTISPECIES: hypothetical protein [unclassified Thiothrix]HRJ53339.1 hypothetical protein [Candidatus Thiothrix moscowensis]HRJ94178.1 hypothetical protein [Candidatus Thiothrix moscowensis]
MKALKIFGLFIVLHAAAWAGTHLYLQQHQPDVLVVVDTSYALKPQFPAMESWINNLQARTRYKNIIIGTDKAMLGKLDAIPTKATIFRTVFGRMSEDNLKRYEQIQASEKILLSDGSIRPSGWKVISFP